MTTKMISKAGSMSGYSFKTWFVKNKDSFKTLLMGVGALATYFATMTSAQWLQILLTVIVPVVIKLGVDAIDFYSTDVVL